MREAAIVLIAITIAGGPAAGQGKSVELPLRGELPVRCSVRLGAATIDTSDSGTQISIPVNHSCNARSVLTVSMDPRSGETLDAASFSYDGQAPSVATDDLVQFIEASPIDSLRNLKIFMRGASRVTAERFSQSLKVAVDPD